MHHLRGGDAHQPWFPPTWGASPPPFCSTLASFDSAQVCRPDAAILAPHVTGGRVWPERQGRDLQLPDSSRLWPGPPRPSPKPRPPGGRRLGVASQNCARSLALRKAAPPPASLACPPPAICQPGRLSANLQGTWGGPGAGLLLRASFSGRLGWPNPRSSLLRPGRCVKAVASLVPPQSVQPAFPARPEKHGLACSPQSSVPPVHPPAPLGKGPVRTHLPCSPEEPWRPVLRGWRALRGGQARFRAREMPSSVCQTCNPRPSSLHVLDKPKSRVI